MAEVIFYEKPGCINNRRQQALLIAAGHRVEARDLRLEAWTAARLRLFFMGLAVADWFNAGSPRVRSGEVTPTALGAEEALALMIADPLLIRRPLMQVGEQRRVGFEASAIHRWIGLEASADDLEICPRRVAKER